MILQEARRGPHFGAAIKKASTTLAAHQACIKRVMLSARNRKDWEEIPEDVRADLEFIWLETAEQAMAAGLDSSPSTKPT